MSPSPNLDDEMHVIKRSGTTEIVSFDKILKRIRTIGQETYDIPVPSLQHSLKINYTSLAMKVIDQLYDNISTAKIDELSAEQCASMASIHPDYSTLAGRLIIANHSKNTSSMFVDTMSKLYMNNDKHGKPSPLITDDMMLTARTYEDELNQLCNYNRDYLIDYFGFKTLERAYLMKVGKVIVERPQHMWLRVAMGIHGDDMDKIIETYELMSQKYFTHATPTLFNAGTPHPQLSSCYLIAMEDDSIEGIYNTLKDCALISKWAGGIGLHIHNVRASGSDIRGTNGSSNGIVPMLRVFNHTAKYVDQCVHPETIIYTTDGPKEIQHCESGVTQIYNALGETEVIQDVLEHVYNDEMLEIKTTHSIFPLRITPEHPVYALRNQVKGLNYNVIRNRLEKKHATFEWVEAKELDENDMIVYSIPKYEQDVSNITDDDCRTYGIILGDGCINCSNDTAGYVSMHTENKSDTLTYLEDYFQKRSIQTFITVDGNITRLRWNRQLELPFRYNDFYNETKQKRILPKWLNLPVDKLKYILKGMLETDGCLSNNEVVFDSTSLNLIESARIICLKMGILTSGSIRDRVGEKHMTSRGVIENKLISYTLRIPRTPEVCGLMGLEYNDKQFFKYMKYGNYLLTRVKDVKTTHYDGIVYDLQMKHEHNYTIHNGLVHNGGGKRNGSFAMYMEPWHADIESFLDLRKNHGDEDLKARDLFYAIWMSDLFMERVKAGQDWTLMCPDECPGLSDVYGDAFNALYTHYEKEGKGRKTIKARDLWFQILDAQMETGTPYLLYKDAVNRKCNQKNLGTIKSSNLCCEITEYSDENETAVCNLASIALPAFIVTDDNGNVTFDYVKLHSVARTVTNNLNKVIDVNFYPTKKTERSNFRHRPVGIGVQGLADVFILLNLPFASDKAKEINVRIFQTIYHAALTESCEIAKVDGRYSTFDGSPASEGILQFDMWEVDPMEKVKMYNWDNLKEQIKTYGLRNSLLVAPMPTASTSQILGYNECIEPITSNIYSRRTIAGDFMVVNKYLIQDLIKLDIWNDKIKNNIVANNGSIQQIDIIPDDIKEKYKTVWEIPMRNLIDMAADRGAYVCQSQSLNLWLEDPTYNNLTSMHFYGWKKGLKTGIYYLRRRARHQAQQFTIEPEKNKGTTLGGTTEDEICEMCSS
jgi:ribonucleoside-diphosphate reductase alpha subunit